MNRELVVRLKGEFQRRFPGRQPRIFRAGGRVNLIGEHVDYHGGPVLPVALARGVYVAAALREDGRAHLASMGFAEEISLPATVREVPNGSWAAYPLAVLRALEERGDRTLGADLVYAADLPVGAGLSSSAALLVVTALALSTLAGSPLEALELARLAHRAERSLGIRCGILDQFASALARRGQALLLDCASQEFEYVDLPERHLAICVFDSMQRRSLLEDDYNRRVEESSGAFEKLRRRLPDRASLAAVREAELLDAAQDLEELELRRARHVVGECTRVRTAAELLRRGDLFGLGGMLLLSHRSLARNYEVSTERLDALVEGAAEHPAVFGARLTGAGFGGCAFALVRKGAETDVQQAVVHRFRLRYGEAPPAWSTALGGAPAEVTNE